MQELAQWASTLTSGNFVLTVPRNMTQDDCDHVLELLPLIERVLPRLVKQTSPTPNQDPPE